MEVKKVKTHEAVETNRGYVAFEYGPVVYCLEEADNGNIDHIMINQQSEGVAEFRPDAFGGVAVLHLDANVISVNGGDVSSAAGKVMAIPYYTWNHRGKGSMAVWLPGKIESVRIKPE